MPGLVPGIHVAPNVPNDVDGRDKPGHDDLGTTIAAHAFSIIGGGYTKQAAAQPQHV